MSDDAILKLALSVHASPGVYALLIGSGVSRAAGILTGWEITLDLIRKIAALQKEELQPDPETWYQKNFGESPDYDKLLDRLTSTPAERRALLNSYFEPNEEEREQGLKLPTAAHRAIADLVKLGHVRMILTTNFDRLIEKALEEEGIVPDVISTDDALKGAVPYVHSKCVVVKVHGDYRDTRIKNTPEELANYSPELNAYLNRILDEFGLIICGWSATWDTALRNTIIRCPTRRFPTFWLAKGELTEEARQVIQQRRAEEILIESADAFFPQLQENLRSLRESDIPHPVTIPMLVETVKRYLSEPKHRIRLHDLVEGETTKAGHKLSSSAFSTHGNIEIHLYQQRMNQYKSIVGRLLAISATIGFHDTGENAVLLTKCIERLLPTSRGDGKVGWLNLQYYPALLVAYSAGIGSTAAKRFLNLAAVLRDTKCYDNELKIPAIGKLHAFEVFRDADKWVPYEGAEKRRLPANDYLFQLLRPVFKDFIPDDKCYEESFDTFEYMLALTYLDLISKGKTEWSPLGRFAWRYEYFIREIGEMTWRRSPPGEFIDSELKRGATSDLLKAGFFGGSAEECKAIVQRHMEWLKGVRLG
jgi:hypothetical protein